MGKSALSMGMLVSLATLAGCAYSPDEALLEQKWAAASRARVAPEQRTLDDGLKARWKAKDGDRWGVVEDDLEDAAGVAPGTKVVVLVPEGSHALVDPLDFEGLELEIIGKGIERSRLILDAGKAGFILNGGSLLVKDLTVSAYTTEGLTVFDGTATIENAHINGARHGLRIEGGTATIRSSVFAGNETALEMGEDATVSIEDTVFVKNWEAVGGEKPRSFVMERSMVLGSVSAAMPFPLARGTRIRHCIIVDNQNLGWTGFADDAEILSNLVSDDAMLLRRMADRDNRALDKLESFPGATPQGIPVGFPIPILQILRQRVNSLGTGKSEEASLKFAENEAIGCLIRARDLAELGEGRKARILMEVAEGFSAPFPTLRSALSARVQEVEEALAKTADAPPEPDAAPEPDKGG